MVSAFPDDVVFTLAQAFEDPEVASPTIGVPTLGAALAGPLIAARPRR